VAGCGPSAGFDDTGEDSGGSTSTATSTGSTPIPGATDDEGPVDSTSTSPPADAGEVGVTGDDTLGDSSDDGDTTGEPVAPSISRVLLLWTPNGYYREHAYSGAGAGLTWGPMLAPLEPFADRLLVVEGIDNIAFPPDGMPVMDAHGTAAASLLTGGLLGSNPLDGEYFDPHYGGGPSLEVVLGPLLAAGTPVASVYQGLAPSTEMLPMGVSYLDEDVIRPPYDVPAVAFDELLGDLPPDAELTALQNAADLVGEDVPADMLRVQLRIAAAAFAHDVTRVQLMTIDRTIPDLVWPSLGAFQSFHELLMDNQPQVVEPVYGFWGEALAELLVSLSSTPAPEGGGVSLLDTTLVVWVSDMGSVPAAHTRYSILTVVIDGSGTMPSGVVEVEADQADLAATIAAAAGVELGPFGHPMLDATPIPELLGR